MTVLGNRMRGQGRAICYDGGVVGERGKVLVTKGPVEQDDGDNGSLYDESEDEYDQQDQHPLLPQKTQQRSHI